MTGSAGDRRGEARLVDLTGGDELAAGVRVRVALDVIGQLAAESAQPLGGRSSNSRLVLGNVFIGHDGVAEVRGQGDTTGAPVLLWEVLAARPAPAGPLPRVHDVVDEIPPDVDEVAALAVERRYATLDELLEALEDAGRSSAATHAEVARAARLEETPPEIAPPPAAPPLEPATARPCVLLVMAVPEADALRGAIEDAGYRVAVCEDASRCLTAAVEETPSCVVVDLESAPDDLDGIREMRAVDSPVSALPLLLLTEGEGAPHLGGFLVGGDVCLKRPFRVHELVIQVGALVRMTERLHKARTMLRSAPVEKVFEGNLAHISVATLLSVLDMERRTGVFRVDYKTRRAQIDFIAGIAAGGLVQGVSVSVLHALSVILDWKKGRFSFVPMPEREPPEGGIGIGELLLEALRRKDEQELRDAEAAGGSPAR